MAEASLLVCSHTSLQPHLANHPRPRPSEFVKQSVYPEDSDEEESTVGKMPPAEDSDVERSIPAAPS